MFIATSAKIIGTPNDSGWTQVHEFRPEDEQKLILRGHLFAVISTKKKEEGIDSVTAGRELLSRLHEEYFGNLETTVFTALKNSIQKVMDEFSRSWGEVEVAATVVVNDTVYSAAGGGSSVSIYREGALAKILESAAGGEVVVASGYPKEGDCLILGTKTFFDSIPQGILKASLEGSDLDSSVEALAPSVHSNPQSGNCGVVFVKFVKETIVQEIISSVIPNNDQNQVSTEEKNESIFQEPSSNTINLRKKSFRDVLNSGLNILGKIIPKKDIYLRRQAGSEEEEKGSKSTMLIGIIFLCLLLVSIGLGIRQKQQKKFKSSYETTLTLAIDELRQATDMVSTDPQKARELFFDSQAKVNELIERKITDKRVTELSKQLQEKESEIVGIVRIEPELYMDLSLLTSGFKGDKIIYSGEKIFVFDKSGKRVVGITLATKKTKMVAGAEQLEGASDIFAYEETLYGVFDDGIYKLGDKKEKVLSKDWDEEIIPNAYAGNIYLLAKSSSVIWRYPGGGGSFGTKTNWLAPGINLDLSKSKQTVIDGTFWILSETGRITRLSLGSPQKFEITGITPVPTSITSIFTNEEQKNIYLLDSNQGKILVLAKEGIYQAQYVSDKLKEATGIVVSEEERKIIILVKEKLYNLGITVK